MSAHTFICCYCAHSHLFCAFYTGKGLTLPSPTWDSPGPGLTAQVTSTGTLLYRTGDLPPVVPPLPATLPYLILLHAFQPCAAHHAGGLPNWTVSNHHLTALRIEPVRVRIPDITQLFITASSVVPGFHTCSVLLLRDALRITVAPPVACNRAVRALRTRGFMHYPVQWIHCWIARTRRLRLRALPTLFC